MVEDRSLGRRLFVLLAYASLTLLGTLTVLPFINVVATSFSDHAAVVAGKVSLWPVNFTLEPYSRIFYDASFVKAFGVTTARTVLGTALSVFLTVITAYPLSRSTLKGRSAFLMMIMFTMVFSGGMIPTYLLIRSLKLLDTFWVLILPGAIGPFSLFVTKSFFESLPASLEEAARIDGANVWQILWHVIVPLSRPVIATISLFYAVYHWNSFFDGIIYISSPDLRPLQVVLREIVYLNDPNTTVQLDFDAILVASQSIKTAAIVVATVPMLVIYPFVQKHFIRGITLGAVKE